MKTIDPKDIKATFYLVATSAGFYGSGETLIEAAKNASALANKRLRRKSGGGRTLKVMGWVNHQSEDCRYGQIKEDARRSHLTITGYDDHDFVNPFIGSFGQVVAWGTLDRLDMSKFPKVVLSKGDEE